MTTKEQTIEFLKSYVEELKNFDLPDSDFPIFQRIHMAAGGRVTIHAIDGRHIATVTVKGDLSSPSMPLGPATMAYATLFVDLANAFMEYTRENTK